MSEPKQPATDVRPNRRKEVFRAVRGSNLTGQRGSWSAESDTLTVAGTEGKSADDELQSLRRVRLGSVVEDEAASVEPQDTRRYTEPND